MNFIKSVSLLVSFLIFSQTQANVQSHFDQIKNDPNALYEFFKLMPKGGELHYHLAGSVYPETMLEIASKSNYCIDKKTFAVTNSSSGSCEGIPIKELFDQPELYEKTVRSWSLKAFTPGEESAHDHFFNAFFKFGTLVFDYRPELVADIIKRAANQNEQYLELMIIPDNAHSLSFGALLKDASSFAQKRKLLLANEDFQKNNEYTVTEADNILQQARKNLGCDTNPQQKNCQVTIKFLYYSLREQPLDNLFAQTLNAFEAVAKSQQRQKNSLVGVNLVQAENGIFALRDYLKQMQIYQYLHQIYPQVNITLHAGELTQELVVPEELNYHIHDALMTGQAQRIGHGVTIAHEENVNAILNYMAKQHIPVEINLSSNQKILNVSGRNHPLNYYLAHHVPIVLSTDDEGVLRTTLTAQYVEAVMDHNLDYPTLKQINRNVLTYAFVPGKSIWANAEKALLVKECQDLKSNTCKKFIKDNEKARLQWELEVKLNDFESIY
ncbi:adenosine deaminase family protein [Legionella sp.]|uniref:adenosine deaminase family protein n=1 Tax=Legionella sp. TaxID=459 RepID=UPI003C800FA0